MACFSPSRTWQVFGLRDRVPLFFKERLPTSSCFPGRSPVHSNCRFRYHLPLRGSPRFTRGSLSKTTYTYLGTGRRQALVSKSSRRVSISAKPRRFCPFHFFGSRASGF